MFRFSSGLRVIVDHRPGSARIAVATVVGSGEQDAPEGQEHVAHLAEHLWYQASTDGVTNAVKLHAWGCEWNALTDLTTTSFLASCPDDVTEGLLDLEAARLVAPLDGIDDGAVALERDVVMIEVEGHRPAGRTLVEAIVSRLDPARPDAMRTARSGVGAFDAATVRAWTAPRYVAPNAVLAIVSPRSPEALRPLLEARFGEVRSTEPVGEAVRTRSTARPTLRMDVRRVPARIAEPLILVSFDLPQAASLADTLLATLLQTTLAARFASDGRVAGLQCTKIVREHDDVLACGVLPAPHLDEAATASLAAEVRARVDVRADLRGKLLRIAVERAVADAVSAYAGARDELGPVPFGWPDLLGRWMLAVDRPPPSGPLAGGEIGGAALRGLQQTVEDALDPQRALVLLLTPDDAVGELPTPRPRGGEVAVAWPTVGVVDPGRPPPLVSQGAPRAVVVQRSDLLGRQSQLVVDGTEVGVVVVGPDALAVLANELPPSMPTLPAGPPGPEAPTEPIRFVARTEEDLPLAAVSWTCRVRPEDDAAAVVASELLGARLFWTLRTDRAWSYTPGGLLLGDRLALGADVLDGAALDAMAVVQDEVRAVAAGRITAAELAVAVRRSTIRTSPRLATARDWAALAVGPGGWRDTAAIVVLASRVSQVDAEAVAAVVGRCDPAAGWEVTGSEAVGAAIAAMAAEPGG